MNRKIPWCVEDYIQWLHTCMCHMLCPIFVCTFLATPQITGTTSMQTCTEKGTDDIGKDAMLVYTVSNMYFYTWLQHIYMLMLETVLLCSLWFHQSRFHLEIKRFFTTKTIEKRVPHTHTHPLTSMSNISPLRGACIGSTGTIFAQRSRGPRDHPPSCFPSTLPMVSNGHMLQLDMGF